MIEQLAKDNAKWLRMAYDICKDRDLSKDLVQDMYIKLYDCQKEINEWYVYVTIKSIFIDGKRKDKEDAVDFAEITIEQAEPELCSHIRLDENYILVKTVFDGMTEPEKKIIKDSYTIGVRELMRKEGYYADQIRFARNKLKQEVWQKLEKRNPQESAMLSRQSQQQSVSSLAQAVTEEKIWLM